MIVGVGGMLARGDADWEPVEGRHVNSPNPLNLSSPRCLLWCMPASMREMQLGIHLMQRNSSGLHNEAWISKEELCYDLFGRLDCWSWVWDIIMGFILLFHLCTICGFTFLHLFMVVT